MSFIKLTDDKMVNRLRWVMAAVIILGLGVMQLLSSH